MAYRINIITAEASESGNVNLPVEIEKETFPGVWEIVDLPDQKYLVVASEKITAITDGAGTDAEKRAAMADVFRDEIRAWKSLAKSSDALIALEELLPPSGWPITIDL